uniref:Glycerophosphodiester phosphodiesterase 1like [Maylandia zebra] n=1 Tax=Lepeophtheirus salmonis TaxID=72036 RepID=A0A0K2V463_LEPSM
MDALGWSLQICVKVWCYVYVLFTTLYAFFFSSFTLHIIAIGLFLCALAYYKLPRPENSALLRILGPDPRNFDGTPSKSKKHIGIIAHRAGGVDEMPENTIGALREAKEKGVKCVEFDVSFSSDGVPFVFHDSTVDRLAINSNGYFSSKSSEEIKLIGVKNKLLHSEEDAHVENIPTLEEFVSECLKLELKMIMDVKDFYSVSSKSKKSCPDIVLDIFQKYPELYNCCLVSSFNPYIIYCVRFKDPRIVCGMAWRPYIISMETFSGSFIDARPRYDSYLYHYLSVIGDVVLKWAYHNFLWHFLGISTVLVHKGTVTSEYIQIWRERGIRVLAWTVNDTLEKIFCTKSLRITPISDAIDPISDDRFLTSICEEEDED